MSRIVVVTEAWHPQMNGVVRTFTNVARILEQRGITLNFVAPNQFRTFSCPTYPEIPIALSPGGKLRDVLKGLRPDAIHIATEGTLGHAARRWCLQRCLPYTSSYHTNFPEYLYARARIPKSLTYGVLKRFHKQSSGVLVVAKSVQELLKSKGFENVKAWSRGVDFSIFYPRPGIFDFAKPIFIYVGRVAIEKNIEAFLDLKRVGTKVVVGDGPQLPELRRRYPEVKFLGRKSGKDLADCFASADVFILPSLTETFGVVQIEALACGTPVAAYPAPGPTDVITNTRIGALDPDLDVAVSKALNCSREEAAEYARQYTWERTANEFFNNLHFFDGKRGYELDI